MLQQQQQPQQPPPQHDPSSDNTLSFTQTALSEEALAQMSFFFKLLEQRWSIKKRNNVYRLKQRGGAKLTYTSEYLTRLMNHATASPQELKQIQLMTFLHNALEGGWNIKKYSTSNNYVFVKKHNGEYKMYEDDEYLTQFMKNNLSLESAS
jgi:hypothetical protein